MRTDADGAANHVVGDFSIMMMTSAHLAQTTAHACSLPHGAVPAQIDPPNLLPVGEYMLELCESSYEPNTSRTGMSLSLKAQIVGGEYDGRPYFIWMDLENDDQEKEDRGQRHFACLRRAIGVLALGDTEQLHWKPFRVAIGVRPHSLGGHINYIERYV